MTAHGVDALAWRGFLSRLPGADIYHTPQYHAAHEANGDGTALCFVAEEGDQLLLHPFMLREIPGVEWRDIETVYGYSGPLATRADNPFLARAWYLWSGQCQAMRVVAEFWRFNPLSGNHLLAPFRCQMRRDRETVMLDLSGGEADLWLRYTKRHRNMVRRALAHGLVPWEPSLAREIPPGFVELYHRTMERCGARDYYRFPPSYFEALRQGLGDGLLLLGVHAGSKLVAAGLFLLHRDRMHYHLSGSDPEGLSQGANNLLLHQAALWGKEHGYGWLHLGGGRTPNPNDSLLRFKASVSRERRPFVVGKRIHDLAAYDALCREWMDRHGVAERPDYFLPWRKP